MWPFHTLSSRQNDLNDSNIQQTELVQQPSSSTSVQSVVDAPLENGGTKDGFIGYPAERLSIPILLRAPILMSTSFVCGFSLGAAKGGPKAGYRYRAENAHRLPTTQTGWFLYQKSKNYHVALGSIKEGTKFGLTCTGWATLFMFTEEIIDRSRERLFTTQDDKFAGHGQRDVASTVVAAMSMAGIYSWKHSLSRFAAAKTARMALKYSIIYGLVQDVAATVRGNKPAYIGWITERVLG